MRTTVGKLKKLVREALDDSEEARKERFRKYNEKIHPVENEWHFKILSPLGFLPEQDSAKGFVRKFDYIHHETGIEVTASSGASSDHWRSKSPEHPGTGYWSSLEPWAKKALAGSRGAEDPV